ncbi:tryptophan synthase subunit alpha [Candidatus Altiarchaeales archaeon WOR_SM1_SCG]|nr:tryptophan synthase subunit alpha [Candidatus Altiarchaeales archaeon WOR_SM1_SCG]
MEKILKHAEGFVYLVSLLGVTGAREEVDKTASELVLRVRKKTELPLCIGFGISKEKHVEQLKLNSGVDGVIVGSAIVNIIGENLGDKEKMLFGLKNFARKMKDATKKKVEVLNV